MQAVFCAVVAIIISRAFCLAPGGSTSGHSHGATLVKPKIESASFASLRLVDPVLTETGYTPVSAQDPESPFFVAEGSAISWIQLYQSFEGKYGPVEDRAPKGSHRIIGWFARCPEDLERDDVVGELARARDEYDSSDVPIACVFFADPHLERDRSVLDPFDDAFAALTMKKVVEDQSIFVFYLSQFWYRKHLGEMLLKKAEAALAEKDAALAAAEERAKVLEKRAEELENLTRELEKQLASEQATAP